MELGLRLVQSFASFLFNNYFTLDVNVQLMVWQVVISLRALYNH